MKPRFRSLIFEVTQRCNHACLYCYNVWRGGQAVKHPLYPRGELGTSETLRLLGKALDEGDCHHVTLSGGEPLFRSDLPIILDFLGTRNVQVTIISNGRLLSESTAASLIHRGVGLFELPLLSHEREMHDRLSAAPGAWDSVLGAMANVRLHGGRFAATFVATRSNIGHLYHTIKLAFVFGAQAIMFNRFNPGGRGRLHLRELLPSVEQVREALAVADSAAVELGIPIACSIPIQPCLIDTAAYPHLGFSYCGAGTERAYYTLDPLGNIRACNHSATILGNLLEEAFEDILAPENLKPFVDPLPATCAACAEHALCQGGCKAAAQACFGSLDAAEPFLRQSASARQKATAM